MNTAIFKRAQMDRETYVPKDIIKGAPTANKEKTKSFELKILEPMLELRGRVARELLSLQSLPRVGYEHYLAGIMGSEPFVRLLSSQELLQLLLLENEKLPVAGDGDQDADQEKVLEMWHKLDESIGRILSRNRASYEQWNQTLNYDKILFSILSCIDKDGLAMRVIDGYKRRIINTALAIDDPFDDASEKEKDIYEKKRTAYGIPKDPQFETIGYSISTITGLRDGLKQAGAFEGKKILEIGGFGLREPLQRAGVFGSIDYQSVTSGNNEGNVPQTEKLQTITSENYISLVGEEPFDVTVSRCVFEPGSGIMGDFGSEGEASHDLLKVLSATTAKGGYSIHEGTGANFPKEILGQYDFEHVLTIKLEDGDRIDGAELRLDQIAGNQMEMNVGERKISASVEDGEMRTYASTFGTGYLCIWRKA